MSVNDPIGDMLTRIRNAQERGKSKVSTPHSKLRENVLNVLQGEGFIRGYAVVQLGTRPVHVVVVHLVGCRRAHPQCGRRSSLHRVLRSHTCLVSERNQFPYRPA